MSRLAVYQSLWAMNSGVAHDTPGHLDDTFAMVADAGFDGLVLDLDSQSEDLINRARPLFRKYGLGCELNAFPTSMEDMQPMWALAQELAAERVNIVARVIPNSVDEASIFIQDWIEEAAREGVTVAFETHRNSATNGLDFTVALLNAVPEMQLCADLSHFVVDHEITLPVDARQSALIDQILQRTVAYQGRIASAQQIQLQIDFPQHQHWVVQFLEWWEQGFRQWRKSAGDDDVLVFQTELGPPEYAMTDAHGQEMSDRWSEAQTLKGWIEDLWARLEREDNEKSVVSGRTDND